MAETKKKEEEKNKTRRVKIIGNVVNNKGQLKGTITLPEKEAARLLRLGVAVPASKSAAEYDEENPAIV